MRLALAAACAWLACWQVAFAVSEIVLPKGETLAQLEWNAEGELLLLAFTGKGWALRVADPGSGELSVIQSPRSFAALPPNAEVLLSPYGNGVAALVPSQTHSEPARLWLYTLDDGELDEVNLRRLDRSFYPATLTWNADGSQLYVSSAPYLGNNDSVIAISMDTGEVESALLKGNIDLISELAFNPRRKALVVKAAGIRGEYPAEQFIALAKAGSAEITVLHTEAEDLSIESLPDGTVFLNPTAARKRRWILLPGEQRLRVSEPRLPITMWTATSDGQWLGGIVDGKAVGKLAGQTYGVLQAKSGGQTVITGEPCSELRFAHDSQLFAAVNADRTGISVLEMPASAAE